MSIASEITRLQNAKDAIKTVLISKNINVPEDSTISDYAELIDQLDPIEIEDPDEPDEPEDPNNGGEENTDENV